MRANVIGPQGIQLQSRARRRNGKLNVPLNQRVEEAWWEWCHAETCTLSGKLDWKGVQDLAVTQCERDGAYLVQMVDADNAFGFALKTWDVTWLDLKYSETLPNGNRVVMSVELDADDKPAAYWLTTPPSEIMFASRRTRTRTRVPAEKIIHGIQIHDDESQVHGVPATAAAILPAKNAYSYGESVVMASRVGANQFGVLKSTVPDSEAQFTGELTDEGQPQHPFIESSPLSITPLLPGWELQQFKPEQPTQNHAAFKESLDMDIAVALGVPYFLLMGNWKAVNFSSSRGGLGEFRERCKGYQAFMKSTLCRRVFHGWLRSAFLTGKLQLTNAEYLEVQNPMFQARGFDYIDPTKDIDADVTKLQNRLTTPSEILAERGIDYLDFLERWKADKELAATFDIDIEAVYEPKQLKPAPAPDDGDEGDPPKKTEDENRGYTNGKYLVN
jgi:lambda family phage portal protein